MRRQMIQLSTSYLAAFALAMNAVPARADLHSAQTSYKSNDFSSAFKQFEELAELGQATAQYALAVMYARGESVASSNTYAHAWASLAAQQGQEDAKDLVAKLEPRLTPASLRVSAQIQAQFSAANLDARLMPHFLRGKEYEDGDPVRQSTPYLPMYPTVASLNGIQGEVYVEFIVPPDGHPRLPRILYATPQGYFEAAVRESVLRSTYLPARIHGQPISTTVSTFYNFKMTDGNIRKHDNLDRQVHDIELKAQSGDTSAQMLLGMMISGLPQLQRHREEALPWFLKAAQAGAAYAQYQVGLGLLMGHGCQYDTSKAESWLKKAAQADQPDAQVTLARYILRDMSNPESIKGAFVWLERAVKQGNSFAKVRAAAIFAASPLADFRDPERALALTEQLDPEYSVDPSLWEIRAAAHASLGDFAAASKAQTRAMTEATRLGWDITTLEQRRSTYAARQAWSGDLLSF